jgi:hypothetical protein
MTSNLNFSQMKLSTEEIGLLTRRFNQYTKKVEAILNNKP